MESSAKNDKGKNAQRNETDKLQAIVSRLYEETRDLYYNKIAGADRETEHLKMELENMEKDSARLNEFCAKLDGETKFAYQTFSCNRNDLEKMQKMHPRSVADLHRFEAELKEISTDLEKSRVYYKECCQKQDLVYAKQEKTYSQICWASKYKKLYDENQRFTERKIETERRIADFETKIKDYEKEIQSLLRDELPWNKVCVQFSETLLKNMQLKKDIRTIEGEIARLTLPKKNTKKALIVEHQSQEISNENRTEARNNRAVTPEKLQVDNPNVAVSVPSDMSDVIRINIDKESVDSTSNANDIARLNLPKKNTKKTLHQSQEISNENGAEARNNGAVTPEKRQVDNPKMAMPVSSDMSDVIRINIDKESVDSTSNANDEDAMHVDGQTSAYSKQNAADTTYPFQASQRTNNSEHGYTFLNKLFTVGGSNFSDNGGNGFFNVFNNGNNGVLDKASENSNDGGGFFGMFGNFGTGMKSPSASSEGNGGGFPFNFDSSSDKEDEPVGGGRNFGFFGF